MAKMTFIYEEDNETFSSNVVMEVKDATYLQMVLYVFGEFLRSSSFPYVEDVTTHSGNITHSSHGN